MVVLATLFSAAYNQAGGIIATRCGERMLTAMTSSTSSSATTKKVRQPIPMVGATATRSTASVTEGECKRQAIETT